MSSDEGEDEDEDEAPDRRRYMTRPAISATPTTLATTTMIRFVELPKEMASDLGE